MKVKDYHTESDIPMNDSGFNVGQKVRIRQRIDTDNPPTVYTVIDAWWSVLDNSWEYTILKPAGIPWEISQDSLMPL